MADWTPDAVWIELGPNGGPMCCLPSERPKFWNDGALYVPLKSAEQDAAKARAEPMDKGPWTMDAGVFGKSDVQSDDFTHDVWLRVQGDFADTAERDRYCAWLRDALNAASGCPEPKAEGETK